eukprot:TRINITY_DN15877_c0_g1_i1.p1 TRINITY_DN15877_c0_g1~~TRINITY_DN15877_c0_g1_i1.p1  ORF type:complete len:308 (+),score=95.87 TRINITY_DN15877_c0_g1_i1:81-926(+)
MYRAVLRFGPRAALAAVGFAVATKHQACHAWSQVQAQDFARIENILAQQGVDRVSRAELVQELRRLDAKHRLHQIAEKSRLKVQIKDQLMELQSALRAHKAALEERRNRKVMKGVGKVALNLATLGMGEAVGFAVDMTEMGLDIADALADGDSVGLAQAIVDGAVGVLSFKDVADWIVDGVNDVSDAGFDMVYDINDIKGEVDHIEKAERRIVDLRRKLVKRPGSESLDEVLNCMMTLLLSFDQARAIQVAAAEYDHMMKDFEQILMDAVEMAGVRKQALR